MFKKAVKYDAKGRVAIIGPSGSGKSFTGLTLATKLANGGKIAALDTEHGSLSKYADLFDFDNVEPDSYTVESWLQYLTYAEQNGYAVFLTDSLSHYWMGKDGALEFVDMAAKRSSSRDGMSGWKEFRPHERAMIDRMIASPCHIICTMRTKTEYVESVNERGKKERKKIGLAPVQRDGMEYEFDLVAYMDDENNFIVEKTRCPLYSRKAITQPKAKDFDAFTEWLRGAMREPIEIPPPQPPPVDIAARRIAETSRHEEGILPPRESFIVTINKSFKPQVNVVLTNLAVELGGIHGAKAKAILAGALNKYGVTSSKELDLDNSRKLAIDLYDETVKPAAKDGVPPEVLEIWKQMTDIASTVKMFTYLRELLGRHIGTATAETEYRGVLSSHGVMHSNEFKGAGGNEKARSAARQMWELIASADKDAEGVTDQDVPN
jgi:hypothetical protein